MKATKTVDELYSLVKTLEIAKANDFIKLQHAKDIFMQALEQSGLNTPKPIRREFETATSPIIVTANSTSQTVEQSTVEVK